MEGSEVFDKLVRELDPIERKALLDKLTPDEVFESEPLVRKEHEIEIDLEKEYYSLGFLSRIIIFFKVTFGKEDKFQLTEEIVLKRMEREIKKNAGEILSYAKGILKQGLMEEIEKLHESVSFFYEVVNTATGAGRGEFLNFLGSLQIPIIHHQLLLDTDFLRTEKKTGLYNPSDVKKEVMLNVETNLGKITGELRHSMYMQSKTIFIMGEIVKYDFAGLENLFAVQDDNNEKVCYFGDARTRLERLTDLLFSFKISPDKQLMEALFLFHNSSMKASDEEAISGELKAFLSSAGRHMTVLKKFNQKMQLARIMKLVTGNIDYKPTLLSGGEDWFNLYSRYWQNVAESRYRKYSAEKRKNKIYQDMQMYFKKDKLPELEYYNLSYKYSCGFLSLFLREQFTSGMNEVLKKILVDGKFYKKSNKEDFTDSYSKLLGLYEKLKIFDEKNSPKGEYELKKDDIKKEMTSESVREKRIAAIEENMDSEALDIIRTGLEGLLLLKNVLYGILHGKAGGQYDSLTNLNKLITIESRDFIIDLNTVYSNIDDAYRLLGDILSLEEEG